MTYDMIPCGRGECLQGGMKLPPPSGHNWAALVTEHEERMQGLSSRDIRALRRASMAQTVRWVREVYALKAVGGKKQRTKAVSMGLKHCPKTLKEAFQGPDSEGWKAAAKAEMDTLTEMGVLDHGYTLEEVHQVGNHTRDP